MALGAAIALPTSAEAHVKWFCAFQIAGRPTGLPIFVRQVRAEHDHVAQARALLADAHELAEPGWRL